MILSIIILSYYHIIILSFYHKLYHHITMLSYYHIIILSYYHIIILSYTISPYYHVIILFTNHFRKPQKRSLPTCCVLYPLGTDRAIELYLRGGMAAKARVRRMSRPGRMRSWLFKWVYSGRKLLIRL